MDPLTRPSVVANHEDKDRDRQQGMHKPPECPSQDVEQDIDEPKYWSDQTCLCRFFQRHCLSFNEGALSFDSPGVT